MSSTELTSKVRELKELKAMAEELAAEITTLQGVYKMLQTDNNAIYSIADEILQAIMQTDTYFHQYNFKTDSEREADLYYDELCKRFKATLNPEQEKLFNVICDVSASIGASETDKMLLYGMQVQESLRTMIDNPAEVLKFYASKGKPIRELYKVEN